MRKQGNRKTSRRKEKENILEGKRDINLKKNSNKPVKKEEKGSKLA
jgi:hypothetical protein